jgi:hypothetical protein
MESRLYRKYIVPVLFFGRERSFLICSLVLYVLVFGQTNVLAAGGNGVDDLRGQWQLIGEDVGPNQLGFNIFVNELGPDPNGENDNVFVATGCMLTLTTGVLTPMSMQAIDQGDGNYDLNIISTVFPAEGDPVVIQFLGNASVDGTDLEDDVAGGSFHTDSGDGDWTATHHDRRRTQCLPVDEIPPPGLEFTADVWVVRNVATWENTNLGGRTNVVSAGMLVTRPDGTTTTVPPFAGIFNPTIDFISEFGYFANDPVPAPSGGVYTMTLLDALGNPIAGTTATDVWTGCQFLPASNVSAEVTADLGTWKRLIYGIIPP